MIYAFSFSCARDKELSNIMVESLSTQCLKLAGIKVVDTDETDYGNGSGWFAAMMKLEELKTMVLLSDLDNEDYVLSVDSDVVFTSPEVFEHVTGADIIGIQHKPFYPTRFGAWGHMSGALIFIRGEIARKIAALTEKELYNIRFNHFKAFDLTENEDVVLSYLCRYVNGNAKNLPSHLSSGDFETDLLDGKLKSFYHLNYMPEQFLGEPVSGKWDLPKVIKRRGIKL